MSVLNTGLAKTSASTGYDIPNSLRFNDDDSAYLEWTPSSAGNRKTWTWSGWVKIGNTSINRSLFSGGTATGRMSLLLTSDNKLKTDVGGTGVFDETASLFRDASAWYHIVWSFNTDNETTSANRSRLYVNGVEVLWTKTRTFADNTDYAVNRAELHTISMLSNATTLYPYDGYLAEVNFIDGYAKTPSDFGETDATYGHWKAKKYTDSDGYGTNGFYLPFKQDYTVEGFSATTYTGEASSEGSGDQQYIGGVGFQPDLVWLKRRNGTADHLIHDSVRGSTKFLRSSTTDEEGTQTQGVKEFNTDGFTVGDSNSWNGDDRTFVAWAWDMGGTTDTNTDGDIDSTVRANTDYGQSIVKWESHSSGTPSIGHGLNQEPELLILKSIDNSSNWFVHSDGLTSDSHYLFLDTSTDESNSVTSITTKDADTFTVGGGWAWGSGDYNVAYCFHSVSGYSKIGSYTGNGSATGTSVTTGFKPAFVMIKRTDGTGLWLMADSTRNPQNTIDDYLRADDSAAEYPNYDWIDFNDTGFQLRNTGASLNASGGDYIYIAFADTREYAYWLDQSGNNNDWTSHALTESDLSLDSPTNNFCTWNPINNSSTGMFKEGNLFMEETADYASYFGQGTFEMSSGKWYFEANLLTDNDEGSCRFGVSKNNGTGGSDIAIYNGAGSGSGGVYEIEGTNTGSKASYTAGAVIGCALDLDNNTIEFFKNDTSQGSTSISSTSWTPHLRVYANGGANVKVVANFGQDSSFAGNKTAQGNQDSGGIGDFYYEPPTGYLALCTKNLPDPTAGLWSGGDNQAFNTVLYTGDGATNRNITSTITPDLNWLKAYSTTDNHVITDSLRGSNHLHTNTTDAEDDAGHPYIVTDGFQVSGGWYNNNGVGFVAWQWKAGGTASSNTDGTITSSVSANPDAGFSIVKYAGEGYPSNSSATTEVGHGLDYAPEIIIIKKMNGGTGNGAWVVGTEHAGAGWDGGMYLDSTGAYYNTTNYFWDSPPTNTVFDLKSDWYVNESSSDYIAYCFHSVDGYSKVGSYTGNASTDGTFVYTGFKPAYVMVKNATGGDYGSYYSWKILDSKRHYNGQNGPSLYANRSYAEGLRGNGGTDSYVERHDFLSNGFKLGATSSYEVESNDSGQTYIYIAFAEHPFKYSTAR